MKLLRGLGWLALIVVVWGALASPERTAQMVVDAGGGVAMAADQVGTVFAYVAEHLPKKG